MNWLRNNKLYTLLGGAIIALAVITVLFATDVLGGGSDNGGKTVNTTVYATATRTPSASSTAMATASATPGNTTAKTCPGDHVVDIGEIYQVPAGCNVKGDVEVNGQKLYDNDPATGLIVSCPHGCTIIAPWGANVTPRKVDDLKAEMLSTGCGSKCNDVKVVVINNKSTKPQVVVTDLCDVSLPKGSKALVPGGCVVSGDVEAGSSENGPFKALYDSDQTTGLVVIVKSDTWIRAPYGASVTNAAVDDVVNAVKQTGCGLPNGCRVVNTVTVP